MLVKMAKGFMTVC